MGVKRRNNDKGKLHRTLKANGTLAEELARNRGIALGFAAAAFTLCEVYGFEDSRVREFVDDMDLRMQEIDQEPDGAEGVLEMFGIRVATGSGVPGENRVSMKADGDLCSSCAECAIDPEDRLYYCRLKDVVLRRGRSKCRSWKHAGRVSGWQKAIMDAGGPPKDNRI